MNEIQRTPIAKAVIYRDVDRKASQQIAREHQGDWTVFVFKQIKVLGSVGLD